MPNLIDWCGIPKTDEIIWTADADLVEVSGRKFSYVNVHSPI